MTVPKSNSAVSLHSNNWLYISFILFGIAQLLPWNFISKSVPYFRYRLANTKYADDVAGFMLSGFTVANFVTTCLLVGLRWDELFLGTVNRIAIGMTFNMIIMAGMALVTVLSLGGASLFWIVLAFSFLSGLFTALTSKGLLAMIARFPPNLTPAMLGGQSVAGLAVSIVSAATTFSSISADSGVVKLGSVGTMSYFLSGALTLAAALATLARNVLAEKDFQAQMGISTGFSVKDAHKRASFVLVRKVLQRIWWLAIGLTATMALTISLYAAFIISPRKAAVQDNITLSLLYVPLIFILYDASDLVGRWLPIIKFFNLGSNSLLLKILPWTRAVAAIVMFFFFTPVNIAGVIKSSGYSSLGILDLVYVILCFLLGITNGYLCTMLFMHAPSIAVSTGHLHINDSSDQGTNNPLESMERETCGALMGFFLNLGLVCGTFSEFLWKLVAS